MRKIPFLSAFMVVALAVPVLAEDPVTRVPADENAAEANAFMTAKLIAVHRDQDRIEVRDNNGKNRTLALAADATIQSSLKPGSEVILSIRNQGAQEMVTSVKSAVPSLRRSSALTGSKSAQKVEAEAAAQAAYVTGTADPSVVTTTPVRTSSPFVYGEPVGASEVAPGETLAGKSAATAGSLGADAAPLPIAQAVRAYESAVARISARARTADQAFSDYTRACGGAKSTTSIPGPAGWSAILEGSAASSEGEDQCGTLLTTAARLGKEVQRELSAAEDAARRSGVLPGIMRQIRTTYGMDWSGWDR